MRRSLTLLVVSSVLMTGARASDWYVDAVNGSDANSGASANSAWKTITFALAHAPAGAQTIHVLPGLYDATNGEVFPLTPKPDFAVVGDAGAAQTVVDAGAASVPVFSFATTVNHAPSFGPATRLEGLALRRGSAGVLITALSAAVSPTLRDLDIAQATDGMYMRVHGLSSSVVGVSHAVLERVEIHNCTRGIYVLDELSSGFGPASSLTVRDSRLVANMQHGVNFYRAHNMSALFERCRLDHNGLDGAFSSAFVALNLTATFRDCSLSRNGRDGWCSDPNIGDLNGIRTLLFERCTIARNSNDGCLFYDDSFNTTDYATLSHTIVYGHAQDIDFSGLAVYMATVVRCCIGDGSFNGVNGTFSNNPKFVDSANGDFRLKWSSPCIDAATSAPPAGTLDLAGHMRDVDGDLNTSEVSDLGAFEFRPLELVGTGELGSLLQWKLWGPQGNATSLYWTRVALPGAPTSTPFGDLDLDPTLASVFRVATAGASAPTVLQRSIPNAAALLVGRTFAFQALTDNAAAPSGKAYTNPVQVTIVP